MIDCKFFGSFGCIWKEEERKAEKEKKRTHEQATENHPDEGSAAAALLFHQRRAIVSDDETHGLNLRAPTSNGCFQALAAVFSLRSRLRREQSGCSARLRRLWESFSSVFVFGGTFRLLSLLRLRLASNWITSDVSEHQPTRLGAFFVRFGKDRCFDQLY